MLGGGIALFCLQLTNTADKSINYNRANGIINQVIKCNLVQVCTRIRVHKTLTCSMLTVCQ
jgi:hypothetical protein